MSYGAVSPTVGDSICLKNCETVDSSSACRQILLFALDARSLKIISTQVNSVRVACRRHSPTAQFIDAC
ncbi:hypothetical protein [Nostoc commune]|uniref:hypothetical protein n=1 Tax=Nostoc commune TaxID=1178 RepID=UPI0011B245A0|nr:hypothetical protein [Nostoc commune]